MATAAKDRTAQEYGVEKKKFSTSYWFVEGSLKDSKLILNALE